MYIFLSTLPVPPGVFTAYVCQRVNLTVVSVMTATRVSTVTDGRSLQPAGGSAVDEGSVTCQREASQSAIVSQATPDQPVTQVKLKKCVKGIKSGDNSLSYADHLLYAYPSPPCRVQVSGRNGEGAAEAPSSHENMHIHQQDTPYGLPQILPGFSTPWCLLRRHQKQTEKGGFPLH